MSFDQIGWNNRRIAVAKVNKNMEVLTYGKNGL